MSTSKDGRPERVLVVLAHPDDPEFFCGGTVARWAAEGRHITYCLLTRGDKGADDPGVDPDELAATREIEQRQAAAVLGVGEVLFLDHADGSLVADLDLRRDVTRIIRQVRPDIIITCDPSNYYSLFINHSDHRAAGQATLDSVWPAARSALYFPELYQEEGLEPVKVHHVYIAGPVHPNTSIDVTDFFDAKLNALGEHKSQIKDLDGLRKRLEERMRDPHSPPDAPRYIERFNRLELG